MTVSTLDSPDLETLVLRVEGALSQPATPVHEEDVDRLARWIADIGGGSPGDSRALATRGALAAGRQCYRLGRLSECSRHFGSAVALSVGLDDATRIDVLLQLVEYELLACDVGNALAHTLEAMAIAERTGEAGHEVRVLTQLGGVLQSAGLHRQADHCWAHALERLGDRYDPRVRGNLWALRFPTGFLADERGDAAAREAFDQLLACAEAAGERFRDSMVANAHCNRAAKLIPQGRLATAREHLAAAANCRNVGDRIRWMVSLLYAMADVRECNTPENRAIVDRFLAADRAPARVFVVESYGVLAALYAKMGEADLAGTCLARLAAERSETLVGLLSALDAPAASAGSPGATIDFLDRLAITAELRDDATGRHGYRMGRLARLIAARAGLPAAELDAFEAAARLHDLGKLTVPDSILLKPGPLDATERHLMRTHAQTGERLIAASRLARPGFALRITRHHHERWDGRGYPDGLAGEAIPLEARIATLADVYDALAHERPYKPAWPHERAMDAIRQGRGTQFDPSLVDAFEAVVSDHAARGLDFRDELERAADASPFQSVLSRLPPAWRQVLQPAPATRS